MVLIYNIKASVIIASRNNAMAKILVKEKGWPGGEVLVEFYVLPIKLRGKFV